MGGEVASQLREFFENETNDELRSIIRYGRDFVDVEYLRDDVADQYSETELKDSIEDTRLDSLHAEFHEQSFSKDHGDLQCMITCFENVIEMNFIVTKGVGAAVAIDAEAMDEAHGLISQARNIVLEERP